MSTLVPDEISMEDPLCNSSFGSMVSLVYVTPVTVQAEQERRILQEELLRQQQDFREVHQRDLF